MPDVIVPYVDGKGEAQKVVISEAAQAAAKAAQEYTAADPQFAASFTNPQRRGVNNLDADSQQALNEALRQLRSNRPKNATVINLHPWPLTFGYTNRFLRGITVPACHPGMPYAHTYIRRTPLDWQYNENGTLAFKPILPIQLASEFLRAFADKDSFGGGVIIYEGEISPDKAGLVETYDPLGRPLTVQKMGYEYDEENRQIPVEIAEPIKKPFLALLQAERTRRNERYLARVRKADQDYHRPDGRGKYLLNDTHTLMAEMLFSEGLIPAVPEWNLPSRLEAGLADENCPACGATPKEDSFKCGCGHILDAFDAYKAGEIQWGHAAMELLSVEQLEELEPIRAQREAVRKRLARPVAKSAAEPDKSDTPDAAKQSKADGKADGKTKAKDAE